MNYNENRRAYFALLRNQHRDGFLSKEEYVHELELTSREAEMSLRAVPTLEDYVADLIRRFSVVRES